MSIKLLPGDRIQFEQNGRKLKGVVADGLPMKSRGEEELIPVIRPANRKRCFADSIAGAPREPRLRWIVRSKLRKLPQPANSNQ